MSHTFLNQLREWAEHEIRAAGALVDLGDESDETQRSAEAGLVEAAATEPLAVPEPPSVLDSAAESASPSSPEAGPEVERVRNTASEVGPSAEVPASVPHPPTALPAADSDPDMPSKNLFGDALAPDADPSLSPYDRVAALISDEHPIKAMETLGEVSEWAQRTVLVPIDEERQNLVFGTGDPHADLMIVGEAPGANEDRVGEPFVGRAGQLLDKILAAINFERGDVYIANILKSRPPGNRDPLAEETAAHIPLLYKQIELVQPKIILAVGKTSGNGLLGKRSSLGSLRGTFHDYHGISLMVTYHPAALLRNPQWKRPTWEDMKLLRTRYDEMVG